MNYQLVAKSSNAKVGPMPVTNSNRSTCPDACPLKAKGCYAEAGYYTRLNWDKVDKGERGTDWDTFISKIAKLKDGIIWRHNVSGDLPGNGVDIDAEKVQQLVQANGSKRGFTYTHYGLSEHNLTVIRAANAKGLTINVSANNLKEAREYYAKGLPTVTIVSSSEHGNQWTKIGNVVQCPAEYKDTNCKQCGLCQRVDRKVIVGFTVHGSQAKQADIIARG